VRLLTANGLPGSPLAISCGIDLDHYRTHRTGGRGVDGTALSVLFVGRLDKEKNVDQLIRAAAALPDVRLEIVGDGACRERLTALAERLGVRARIRFHGFVSDLPTRRRVLHAGHRRVAEPRDHGGDGRRSPGDRRRRHGTTPPRPPRRQRIPLPTGKCNPPRRRTRRLAEFANNLASRAAMGQASRTIITRHDIQHTLDTFEGLYRTTAGTTALPTLVA
jgi:glycosyltransferase involved in cell wall biosynthesis